ncbi:unnamed protein product, partial [Heterosigma akashiwo]
RRSGPLRVHYSSGLLYGSGPCLHRHRGEEGASVTRALRGQVCNVIIYTSTYHTVHHDAYRQEPKKSGLRGNEKSMSGRLPHSLASGVSCWCWCFKGVLENCIYYTAETN